MRNKRKHLTLEKGQNKLSVSTLHEFHRQTGGYSTRTLCQVMRLIPSPPGVFTPCGKQYTLNTIATNLIAKCKF